MVRELENESEVIRRCQEGDLRAFEIVYQHFEQPLLGLGFRMLGRREDAEDAVQTTFLKLFRGISKFQFGSKFSTYLFRIMMNVSFDIIRNRKRDNTQELEAIRFSYQPGFDLRIQLEEAISSLPDRMRACFIMFAVEEFKQNEIAEILNVSIGTVKAHIFEAKTRLRALLSDSQTEVTP